MQKNSKQGYGQVDEFEIKSYLGDGSYGDVYVVHDKKDNKYAMKIFKPDCTKELQERQCQNHSRLKMHPHIATCYAYRYQAKKINEDGSSQTVACLIMEYVDGYPLQQFLKQRFQPSICRAYFYDMVEAVEYMHKIGIYHLDLKPANTMIDRNGALKIIDLGLSSDHVLISNFRGSFPYVAPEILFNKQTGTPYNAQKADIFSLGVILFRLFTKFHPFNSPNIEDSYYKALMNNTAKYTSSVRLWDKTINVEEPFIELIRGMLFHQPKRRWTFQQIKSCKWYKGDVATKEQVSLQISKRLQKIEAKQLAGSKNTGIRGNKSNLVFPTIVSIDWEIIPFRKEKDRDLILQDVTAQQFVNMLTYVFVTSETQNKVLQQNQVEQYQLESVPEQPRIKLILEYTVFPDSEDSTTSYMFIEIAKCEERLLINFSREEESMDHLIFCMIKQFVREKAVQLL